MCKAAEKMTRPKQTYCDMLIGAMQSLQLGTFLSNINGLINVLYGASKVAATAESKDAEPDVSSTSNSPPIDFALFTKLAGEIQDLIWEHASNTPRIITIEATTLYPIGRYSRLAFRTDSKPSGLWAACRGSRTAMMKTPQISIELFKQPARNSDGPTNSDALGAVLINPEIDVILLWSSLDSPSLGGALTPWLSSTINEDQSPQNPHPAAKCFTGVQNFAFCLPATSFMDWLKFKRFPLAIDRVRFGKRIYVFPTHPIDDSVGGSGLGDFHPILSGKELTLQYRFKDTSSKLEAMKLTDVEEERFEMMFKKRLVRWQEEKPTLKLPEGIVAVVKTI